MESLPHTRTLAVLFTVLLIGACANLMPAQPPQHRFENAHTFGATALAFSPDGAYLASGGYRGEIALWRIASPAEAGRLLAHSDSVRALHYVTQERLVSSGDDGRIIIWDVVAQKVVASRQSGAVTSLSAGGDLIITGHRDGLVRAWRFPSLEPSVETKLPDRIIALSRHGGLLAVATNSGKVSLFDLSLQPVRDLQTSGPAAHDLRFSHDGRLLAAGGWFEIMLWEVASGSKQTAPAEHNGLLTSVDFSPDGKYLVSLGRHTDSAIRLWDRRRLVVERRYAAHELCGAMIRVSPDGRYMASASDDESVRLYDLSLPYRPEPPLTTGMKPFSLE